MQTTERKFIETNPFKPNLVITNIKTNKKYQLIPKKELKSNLEDISTNQIRMKSKQNGLTLSPLKPIKSAKQLEKTY